MRVILFQPRFARKVAAEEKTQTIRKRARCKPGDVLSLREWTNLPYRSKQREIHRRICKSVKKVAMRFRADGKFIIEVDGREVKSRDHFAARDGFTSFDDMVKWFLDTHGTQEIQGELITWHKAAKPPANKLAEHRAFQWPASKRYGYALAILRADHAHWCNEYDTDPAQAETNLAELEDCARVLAFFQPNTAPHERV